MSRHFTMSAHREAQLEARAHNMRLCHPTESESLLWEAIRAKRVGVVFRRQVVIAGKYIADFVAPSPKVIVEVDGGCHVGRVAADARRDRELERLGYTIVRVSAEQVLSALPLAVERVHEVLKALRSC